MKQIITLIFINGFFQKREISPKNSSTGDSKSKRQKRITIEDVFYESVNFRWNEEVD